MGIMFAAVALCAAAAAALILRAGYWADQRRDFRRARR